MLIGRVEGANRVIQPIGKELPLQLDLFRELLGLECLAARRAIALYAGHVVGFVVEPQSTEGPAGQIAGHL